jgi:sarcosine oxidase
MATYHTIVIGLGAHGSAAAHHLAKLGHHVLGLDRFAPPHAVGSSHGDTRITRLAVGEGTDLTPLALRSHVLWRELERETGTHLLTVCGGLVISTRSHEFISRGVRNFFDNTVAAARRHGIAHELLDANEIRGRFPQFAVRDHEEGYFEPEAGFLAVEACVAAQLARARALGADIRVNETVTGFAPSADGVTVTTDKGTYRADCLLVAAGPWLPQLIGPPVASLFRVTRQVMHWFETKAPAATFAPGTCPIFIWELADRPHGIYGIPALDPAGGVKVATELAHVVDPDTVERAVAPHEAAAAYADYVAPYVPGLGPRAVTSAVCLYTEAPGGRFVIDTLPEHPRVTFASACSGHGFKHSAALGEALAQRLVHGESAIDLRPFGLAALRRHMATMTPQQLAGYRAAAGQA